MLFIAEAISQTPEYIHFIPLMIAFLTGIAGPVLLVLIKHKLIRANKDLEKRKTEFKHAIEIQDKVNTSLNQLQQKYIYSLVFTLRI
jgi:hypothetical protein